MGQEVTGGASVAQGTQAPPTPTPTTPTPASAKPATTPAANAALVLDINVKDLTWMKVSADGNVVLSDNIRPGSTQHFAATTKLDVVIGNAGGASLKINGRDLPSLGQTGTVRELVIN